MGNLLTGDFEAVLQVSDGTMNRLLASMHQLRPERPGPHLPHSVGVRIGDTVEVDGVRGTAWAQVGVPTIHLLDRATDRFALEADLRIRYVADPDTAPLATYIQGRLQAIYVIEDIDPNCPGWRQLADEYWWIRVLPGSVEFSLQGAGEDSWQLAAIVENPDVGAAVNRQLAALLQHSFEPAPQRVGRRFGKGSFISINQPYGTIAELPSWVPGSSGVSVGGSAIVVPVGLTQDPPADALGSLGNVVLAGRDIGLAIGQETIMGLLQPALDAIRNYHQTFTVSGDLGSTVYRASVSSATAVWVPHGSFASIEVAITGGAHTDSILPDITFTANQRFDVGFDSGAESLQIWAAGSTASATSTLPRAVLHNIAQSIADAVSQRANAAAGAAAGSVAALSAGLGEVVGVLRDLDDKADAHFDGATFHLSGIVLRGWVSVAARRTPKLTYKKLDADGFSALDAWIPGGRIDHLRWSWTFDDSHVPGGHVTLSDRYVLRRQTGLANKWGLLEVSEPLPGLDGYGQLCLTVVGQVRDPDTGAMNVIETQAKCFRYGFIDILTKPPGGAVFTRDYTISSDQRRVDAGLVAASAHQVRPGPNKLVVLPGPHWSREMAATLADGLEGCRRDDAGLLVLVLLPDGALATPEPSRDDELAGLGARLGAPVVVNEDVDGSWSRALVANGDGPAWRLLSPGGGVLWAEDGALAARDLSAALDVCLHPSPRPEPVALHEDLDSLLERPDIIGALLDHHHHQGHHERAHCPSLGLTGVDPRALLGGVAFVRKHSTTSAEQLRTLMADRDRADGGGRDVLVVVDDATEAEARELADALGAGFAVVGDRDGAQAGALGVRVWPTTVSFDQLHVPVRSEEAR